MTAVATRRRGAVVAVVAVVLLLSRVFPQSWPIGRIAQGAILGVATGLLALGIVLIYRTTRVINLAYGAMGACAAEVGVALFQTRHWPWLVCVAIAIAAGAVIGLIADAVLRRFANAPRLVVTVASIMNTGATLALIMFTHRTMRATRSRFEREEHATWPL